ncbi:DNA gyrase inhibitor YacG [Qipengyuania sp. 6B39]|uniref:DNA gyrase inhibitor YacG n=1 Tax=Qipengyuania proteolytica TaxID=2867239 RepID=UPI001C89095C|nr:DNA gyrase inhibitor YacG [Qipengyuania proteolytica]MBX7495540.1 DNA gyrase inhibitor YacG [Qipengyuania proteolytica]
MTRTARTCPICKKARTEEFAPFCSSRCRDRDLSQWFGDGYSVAGRPALPEEIAAEVMKGAED